MSVDKNTVNIKKIATVFEKIHKGIVQFQLDELDKELIKIYPTNESEILLSADYSEDDNSVGISIYVSKPQTSENTENIPFDKIMFEYLIRCDIEKLTNFAECVELMERAKGDKYDIDFIPVFYTKEIDKYDLHLRITKIV